MSSIVIFASWAVGGCISAELLGYLLHRLLHSGAIGFLSRSHMRHHLVLYGPLQKQRSSQYRDATTGGVALGNVGIEWLLPAAVLIACLCVLLHAFHVRLAYILLYLGTTLAWSFLMFSYLHDVMHVEGAWLEKNDWLKKWFVSARKRHDIHHCTISDEGLMNKNYGIGLFVFDRLFGTLAEHGALFNHNGYRTAQERFRSVLDEMSRNRRQSMTSNASGSSVALSLLRKGWSAVSLTRAGILGMLVAFTLLFPGCGSGSHANKQCAFFCERNNDYLYTANAGGNSSTVSTLASDTTSGKITSIAGSPYNDSGSGALAIIKAPLGGPLYVANNFSGDISAFTVDTSTGELTTVTGSPFPAEMGMDSIAIDPSGTFLYAVTGDSTNLWAYSIDSSGALTPLPNIPMAIPAAANGSSAVVLDPAGKYLYVMMQSILASNIYGFVRDSTSGGLTALSGFPKSLDGFANKGAFDLSGRFLLVAGTDVFGTAGGIDVFSVDSANGSLTLNTGSPVQVGDDPSAITFDELGTYLYVTNTADVTISEFTFDDTVGTLSAISGSPIPSGGKGAINGPLGIAVSSTDRFVYVCNASNDISVFTINSATGVLSPVTGSPFAAGGNAPTAIVFVP